MHALCVLLHAAHNFLCMNFRQFGSSPFSNTVLLFYVFTFISLLAFHLRSTFAFCHLILSQIMKRDLSQQEIEIKISIGNRNKSDGITHLTSYPFETIKLPIYDGFAVSLCSNKKQTFDTVVGSI